MNGYFIHTIEFCKRISYEEYWQLRNTMKFISYHKENPLHEVRCLDYNDSGLIMILRKYTEKERLSEDFNDNYQLMLIINPSRIITTKTYINMIYDINEFIHAINILENMIYCIFEKYLPNIKSLEDFKFNRIDITKDIHDIPETIVCEYILLMRRMQLYDGYKIDRQIEKNCNNFRIKDSFNLVNESRGIEFVIYNKHQAAVDKGYSDDTIEFYKDTLRMELRCKRKYINKLTKGMSNAEGLIYFYRNMQNFIEKIFFSAFRDTNVCHVSAYALDKLVKRKMKTKKVKCSNMRNLVTILNKKFDMDIDTALDLIWNSDRTKVKIVSYFRAMALSPLAIQCKDVPYLQSLESLLEFTLPNENDDKYYRLMKKLSRGKEVFLHEQSY